MRVAYVVVSHRNPDQVMRLVAALGEGPAAEVLVRHDGRRSRLDESTLQQLGVRMLHDDFEFEWGGWTQVQVLLRCLQQAADRLDPDWLLVVSGQDYPLRPMAMIEETLAASGLDAMLGHAWELDTSRLPGRPADEFFLRYAYRHYRVPAPRFPGRLRPLVYVRELPPRLGLRRARLPFHDGFRCFVSADWLTLNRRALRTVLAAADERRELMRYYRRVAIPSESFFASVLLNDDSLRVAPHNRRFLSFSRPLAPHPDTLTTADLDRLVASDCDFARKFDTEVDAKVLDELDDRRRSESPR